MKAMILAAGFGTRLSEVSKTTPKCLVEIAPDLTILEHVVSRLKLAGVSSLVINLHYLSEKVRNFVESKNCFGLPVQFSYEKEILGTGGGIKAAKSYLAQEPFFIVHNADVYSEIDLSALVDFHKLNKALVSLAVLTRETSRPLLFSTDGKLVGNGTSTGNTLAVDYPQPVPFGFTGVQVISSDFFEYLDQFQGSFSSISAYLFASKQTFAKQGNNILAFDIGNDYWVDIGTPERLESIRQYRKTLLSALR